MNYRLALDMGTNSLGWAVWELGERLPNLQTCELKELQDAGVRIFSDGRDEKENSLAEGRRVARGMRRRRRRLKRRKINLARELCRQGLLPPHTDQAAQREFSRQDPYKLRYRAVRERLEPFELGRALFHLGQRRGYRSNARLLDEDGSESTDSTDSRGEKGAKAAEETKNRARISELERLFEQYQQQDQSGQSLPTLGSFLYLRHARELTVRFRSPDKEREKEHKKHGKRPRSIYQQDISAFYPTREMYQKEFAAIEAKQGQWHPLDWQSIRETVFYQRPLRQPERGKCWYYEDLPRAYTAQISSARLRIVQDLLNLRTVDENGTGISLNHSELDRLYQEICKAKTMSFKQMRKLLGWSDERSFNLEKNRKELKGNPVEAELSGAEYFGALWGRWNLEQQDEIVERMVQFVFLDEQGLEREDQYLAGLGLSEDQRQNIFAYALPSGMKGTQSASAQLQRELLQRLLKERPHDGGAVIQQNLHQEQQKISSGSLERLPYYGEALPESCYPVLRKPSQNVHPEELKYGRIGNPTVHVALNQLRKVVNALVDRYGKPAEVVIELGRDLKNSKKMRKQIGSAIQENEKTNKNYNKTIESLGQRPSRERRRKLALFYELSKGNHNTLCPYCGGSMSMSQLFSSNNEVELEHILPYSRTLDSTTANLTVAHTACNREKGNRSPYEAFAGDTLRWQKIQGAIANLRESKRRRFTENAMRLREEDEQFLSRQLTDNAYIARKSMHYLKLLCPQVWANNGSVTELLRDSWGLDSLLYSKEEREEGKRKGKNREDHRHHALDAIVIGMVDRGMLLKITKAHMRTQDLYYEQQRKAKKAIAGERPGLRSEIEGILNKICVSHKPDHNSNQRFFEEMAYGRIWKVLPLQNEKHWLDSLPILASRKQADFLLDYLREHAAPEKKEAAERDKVWQRLQDCAASTRHVESLGHEWPELRQKAGKFYKAKILGEAAEAYAAYALEHKAEGSPAARLRCWKEFFVTTRPLTGVKEDDCKPIEEHSHGPANEALREKLRESWAEYKGTMPEPKWENFLAEYGRSHNIRAVRYIPKNQQGIVPLPSQPHIYYANDGFIYCDVWAIPPQKKGGKETFQGEFISYYQAENGLGGSRPHPAARRVARLHKKDLLYSQAEDCYYLVRGFSATDNRLDIARLSFAGKGQQYVVISKIFGERQCRPTRLDALGRLRCWSR